MAINTIVPSKQTKGGNEINPHMNPSELRARHVTYCTNIRVFIHPALKATHTALYYAQNSTAICEELQCLITKPEYGRARDPTRRVFDGEVRVMCCGVEVA